MANTTDALSSYLRTVRNSEKRRYADAYLAHVTTGAADPDVRMFNMRNWSPSDVRVRIDAILNGTYAEFLSHYGLSR